VNSERQSDLYAVIGIVFAEDTMVNRDPFAELFHTIFKLPVCVFVRYFKDRICIFLRIIVLDIVIIFLI
jgi:hypothetical protein